STSTQLRSHGARGAQPACGAGGVLIAAVAVRIRKAMRKIDIFNHIHPAAFRKKLMQVAPDTKDMGKRVRGIPMLADLDVRFRVMDAFDEYQQVLSLPTPPIEVSARAAVAIDLARAAND